MPLTAAYTVGAPSANCVIDGTDIVPNGKFYYRLTLSLSGGTITGVTYGGGPSNFTVTKLSNLSWNVTIQVGESVFDDESFEFVQYDENFVPTFFEVDSVDDQPENSSVFVYNPPIPFERTKSLSFDVSYTSTPVGNTPGVPTVETVTIPQHFVWDPDIGLGALDLAIENSVF
jgi:hypothetical protein